MLWLSNPAATMDSGGVASSSRQVVEAAVAVAAPGSAAILNRSDESSSRRQSNSSAFGNRLVGGLTMVSMASLEEEALCWVRSRLQHGGDPGAESGDVQWALHEATVGAALTPPRRSCGPPPSSV
jgi:hypothetical protein